MSSSDSSDSSLTSSLAAGAAAVSAAAAAGAATAAKADGSARKALTCDDKKVTLVSLSRMRALNTCCSLQGDQYNAEATETSLLISDTFTVSCTQAYLVCQGEGVICLHSDSQDFLVAIDDGVGDRSKSGVANLKAYASDVPHTLKEIVKVNKYPCKQVIHLIFRGLNVILPPGTWHAEKPL